MKESASVNNSGSSNSNNNDKEYNADDAVVLHDGDTFIITKHPCSFSPPTTATSLLCQYQPKIRFEVSSSSSFSSSPTAAVICRKKCTDSTDCEAMTRLSNEYNILTKLQHKQHHHHHHHAQPSSNIDSMLNSNNHHHHNEKDSEEEEESGIRRVLTRSPPTGRIESIDLEYIQGIPLSQWIVQQNNQLQQHSQVTLTKEQVLQRVEIAYGVTKCVAEVHKLGLVHNDITASNFIVIENDEDDEEEEDCWRRHNEHNNNNNNSGINCLAEEVKINNNNNNLHRLVSSRVKIIDFGYASFQHSLESGDYGETINDDLPALSDVLHLLFSDVLEVVENKKEEELAGAGLAFDFTGNNNNDDDDDDGYNKSKAKDVKTLQNLPASVVQLLQDLPSSDINTASFLHNPSRRKHSHNSATFSTPFTSANEIKADLLQFLQDPEIFLFDLPSSKKPNDLYFSEVKLHGRDKETNALLEACKRILPARLSQKYRHHHHHSQNYQNDNVSHGTTNTSVTKDSTNSQGRRLRGEIILVSGRTGVGKSELIRRVVKPWIMSSSSSSSSSSEEEGGGHNGYFVQGKFDQLQNTRPYSAFRTAFGDLCEMILARGDDITSQMSQKILNAVGSVATVTSDVVPNLVKIIGPLPPDSTELIGYERQNQFDYVIRKFVTAVSTPEHPVVIFLDDLQWADDASLSLIRTLLNGSTALLIGSYRDDEVDPDSLFGQMLCEESSSIATSKILIPPLDKIAVEHFVSYSLRTTRRLTRPLADVVLKKTDGNTFFVVQYLRSLCDENLLSYDDVHQRWCWDLDELRSREISDDLVDLFSEKITTRLGTEARGVLTLAAGVGSTFRESTLRILLEMFLADDDVVDDDDDDDDDRPNEEEKEEEKREEVSTSVLSVRSRKDSHLRKSNEFRSSLVTLIGTDVKDVIKVLEKEGLIMRTGVGSYSRYKFSHDQIQKAAYSLTPEVDRPLLHLRIGRVLLRDAEYYQNVEKNLFLIVDQLNRAKSLIVDDHERFTLANLNLSAGERSIKLSAHLPALLYLRIGICLLKKNEHFSTKHYDTSLRLYTSTAEAEFVNGNTDKMEDAIDVISKNATCFLDRFPSYMCLVKSYIARGKTLDALSTGFEVLSQLGEQFPKSAGIVSTACDMMKTKKRLNGKTDEQIENLPIMKDNSKIAAMRMLNLVYSCCYIAKQDLLPLVIFRMIRLSLNYGLSHVSAFAFASYGFVQSAFLGNPREGYRYAKISLSLLEKFDTKELHSRSLGIVWYFVAPWRENRLCDTLEHFTYASKVGMEVGDHEYAMFNLVNFGCTALYCGRPLAILQDEMKGFQEYMISLDQNLPMHLVVPFRQCILNLMGRSDNPLVLRGAAMNEEDFIEGIAPENITFVTNILHHNHLILAYMFGAYKEAVDHADKTRTSIHKALPGAFVVVQHVFYDALSACAFARESNSGRRKHKKVTSAAIKKMKKWAANSPSNCLHKLRLLEAEYDALRGKKSAAHRAYEIAVDAAHKSEVMQDEALAHERAALFFRELGDEAKASRYLAIAHQLYLDWGADAKSSQLQTKYSTMVSQARRRRSFQDYMVCRTASVSPRLPPE